jgi:hypothetical protein
VNLYLPLGSAEPISVTYKDFIDLGIDVRTLILEQLSCQLSRHSSRCETVDFGVDSVFGLLLRVGVNDVACLSGVHAASISSVEV